MALGPGPCPERLLRSRTPGIAASQFLQGRSGQSQHRGHHRGRSRATLLAHMGSCGTSGRVTAHQLLSETRGLADDFPFRPALRTVCVFTGEEEMRTPGHLLTSTGDNSNAKEQTCCEKQVRTAGSSARALHGPPTAGQLPHYCLSSEFPSPRLSIGPRPA